MDKKETAAATKRYTASANIKLKPEPFAEYEEALKKLNSHLETKHKKRTAEREFVLDVLYSIDNLIDPTRLHELVCNRHGMVSRASIYNSLLLFQELGLVRKIQVLNDSLTFYERALGNEAHPFAVCQSCGTIWSLPPLDLAHQIDEMTPSRFTPLFHSLIVGGICQKCLQKKKKEEVAQETAYQENLLAKETKKLKAKARKKGKKQKLT